VPAFDRVITIARNPQPNPPVPDRRLWARLNEFDVDFVFDFDTSGLPIAINVRQAFLVDARATVRLSRNDTVLFGGWSLPLAGFAATEQRGITLLTAEGQVSLSGVEGARAMEARSMELANEELGHFIREGVRP